MKKALLLFYGLIFIASSLFGQNADFGDALTAFSIYDNALLKLRELSFFRIRNISVIVIFSILFTGQLSTFSNGYVSLPRLLMQ